MNCFHVASRYVRSVSTIRHHNYYLQQYEYVQSRQHQSILLRLLSTEGGKEDSFKDIDADINYVRNAMKKWIKAYVVDHGICPFAKKSDYRIVVWPSKDKWKAEILDTHGSTNSVSVHTFLENEIDNLLESKAHHPNTFVVFPFVKEFARAEIDVYKGALGGEFGEFYFKVASEIKSAGSQFDCDDCEVKVTFFPFHIDSAWSFKTPWPALHLLRMCDLDKVRGPGEEGHKIGVAIREKNNKKQESDATILTLAKIVTTLAKFPDPIVITKEMSAGQRDKLHKEGYRVKNSHVSSNKPVATTIQLRKKLNNKPSKKHKGKQKSKR